MVFYLSMVWAATMTQLSSSRPHNLDPTRSYIPLLFSISLVLSLARRKVLRPRSYRRSMPVLLYLRSVLCSSEGFLSPWTKNALSFFHPPSEFPSAATRRSLINFPNPDFFLTQCSTSSTRNISSSSCAHKRALLFSI